MKIKILNIIICSMLIVIFLNGISAISSAKEGDIVITDIKSEYINVEKYGRDTWEFYKIIVDVENKGDLESYNITVELQDEDGNYTRNYFFSDPDDFYILESGESESYIFDGHPILDAKDHTIKVLVYPTSTGKTVAIYDSMTYTFNKDGPSEGVTATSTPGFEIITLFGVITILYLVKKTNKKKK